LVATADVARGDVLGSEQLAIKQWPKDHVPDGVLTSMDDAIDRTATVKLFVGEPILLRKLAPKDAGRGMAAIIPTGMRAFTIATSHVSAGGGFALPGNHVDVLLTTTSNQNDGTGGAATTTLLQHVQILAVAQVVDAPDTNLMDPKATRDVTLLVTPNQAAKLDLGMNKGLLHLSLRNATDSTEADTRPATLADLRFTQEAATVSGELLTSTRSNIAENSDPVVAAESVHREARIRTLRGMNRGMIRVELISASNQSYGQTQE
jgi:pilus assembly protein CpaB